MNREQELLDILTNRNNYSYEDVQAAEFEYQELLAARSREELEREDEEIGSGAFIFEVEGTEINLRDYIETDANHRVVAIALNRKFRGQAQQEQELAARVEIERQQYRNQIIYADAAADAKYNELYEQFSAMKVENQILKTERDETKDERHEIKSERDDFERRFQAATSEIDSLKQQLEVVTSKVETPKLTNLNGNLAEAMEAARKAKRAIYDVKEDADKINYTAKFLDTDEIVTDKLVYIGKYRRLKNEDPEVSQFRQEQAERAEAQAQAERDTPEDTAIDPSDFRDEPTIEVPALPSTTVGLDEGNTGGEVLTETFEQEVRRRLIELERNVFGKEQEAA